MKRRDEIGALVQQARIRNVLIEAIGRRGRSAQLREAADRVMRLSDPGTPERLLTLQSVAEDSGVSAADIVKQIQRQKAKGRQAK
jgi:hypothetical protein